MTLGFIASIPESRQGLEVPCLGAVCSDSVDDDYLCLHAVNELSALGICIRSSHEFIKQPRFSVCSTTSDHVRSSFNGSSLSLI